MEGKNYIETSGGQNSKETKEAKEISQRAKM